MIRFRWMAVLVAALALLPDAVEAQERGTVTGVVTAQETQQPLQGAQVRIAGTTLGTITNQQGRFVITNVPAGARTVQVTFIGYRSATQEVAVTAGGSASVNLTLATDVLGLDELVVVGYGVERRRAVAGAVSSMRAAVVEDLPTPTIDNALQGRLAGVQVTQNSGNPGSAITVRVRGSSSISAGNQPLYVIDGVPLTQGNFSLLGYGGQTIDALSDLNPNEIESIEVLKDASAAAIYGSRASNGVILITTRRGRTDRAEINFNSYYGSQRMWRMPEFLNTEQYVQVYQEGRAARGLTPGISFRDDNLTTPREADRNVSTNWIDEVLRSAPILNVDGSIRGGTERTRYFVSGSAFDQTGMVLGFGYERLNGRLNLDYTPFDRLTLGTNISLARGLVERSRGDNTIYGPFANAIANPPWRSVYLDDGSYNLGTEYSNPVALALENEGQENSLRVLGNTFASYTLTPGISLRGSLGLDQYTLRSRRYDSPIVGPYTGSGGAGWAANSYVTKVTYEGTANYNHLFGERHNISGVVGSSLENNVEEYNWVEGQSFPTEFFRYLTSAAQITAGSSSLTRWSLLSFFGRMTYSMDDRYIATFNLRTDGSSRFGDDNRFGTFPSASLLWRVSEEPFMQAQGVFDDFAVRVSYGRTGNQQGLGNFASRGLFGGGFNYDDQPGIAPSQLANPALRWESTDQFNVGTDLAFLNNRLAFGVDYYQKDTRDLLVARPVPRTTGFSSIWSNVGSMENHGIEFTARAALAQAPGTGFNWTADFNISRNRNRVTALLNNEPINSGFASRIEVGQPLGAFYGYVTDGLFQQGEPICLSRAGETAAQRNARCAADGLAFQSSLTAPGDIRFRDLNGDGVITDADRTIIGSPWPEWEGGLTNSLSYGGVDLTAFLQFSQGNQIFNSMRTYTDQYGSFWDNHSSRALDRWTPQNTNTVEPRAIWGDPNLNTRNSDRFVEDGSYLRLKNVVVGYTVPERFATNVGLRRMRVYLQGQNLLTFTSYSGFDPEVNYAGDTAVTRGTDFYTMPQARTVTAGFNIGF
jgi:TonB-dependent starch-binding outer membrane protein SusC